MMIQPHPDDRSTEQRESDSRIATEPPLPRAPGCLAWVGDPRYHDPMDVTHERLLERIWIDPARCSGKPCIRGHRIWVSLVLDLLASGATVEEILSDYPGLEADDIRACLAYGSEMARERFVDIPLEAS